MRYFLVDTAIAGAVGLPLFYLTFTALWRLRARGVYTVLLGPALAAVALRGGFWVAPRAMLYHHGVGVSPAAQGVLLGCVVPMGLMCLYHVGEWRRRRASGASPGEVSIGTAVWPPPPQGPQ